MSKVLNKIRRRGNTHLITDFIRSLHEYQMRTKDVLFIMTSCGYMTWEDFCKVTTSKARSVSFDRERLLLKDLLGKYMSSANIPIDSDLYGGCKDYISMLEEMSVILGF